MSFELDADELAALYRAHAETLLVYFTRRCYDAQLALDLVADTFARAHAQRARFRGHSEADAMAWIWAIARNALRDALRRGRAERRALSRLDIESPQLTDEELVRIEQLAGLEDLRAALSEALERLAPEQREALRLRIVQELDYATVASRLGVSQATARARVSRGLRALTVALDGVEGAR